MTGPVALPNHYAAPPEAELSLAEANLELRRLSRQLNFAQAHERTRIARELHDDVQQILVGLRMNMEASLRARAAASGNEARDWIGLLQKAIDHLHVVTVALHQPGIGRRGLASELRAHINRLALAEGQTIELTLDLGVQEVAPEIEVACFRIIQEGLANAIKHSQATHLRVQLKRSRYELCVSIDDDGVGFDVPIARAHAGKAGSIGLLSMAERAGLAGGRLRVQSSEGNGTHIRGHFKMAPIDS
jgi:signal transduction histidine kinase